MKDTSSLSWPRLASLLVCCAAGAATLRADTITIAATGGALADGGAISGFNAGFSFQLHPALTDAGEVAFFATAAGTAVSSDRGIFLGTGGPLTTVARKGTLTPDGVNAFDTFAQPAVNHSGHILFHGSEGSPGVPVLYRFSPMGGDEVARQGEAVPGAVSPSDVFFGFPRMAQHPPAPNAAGDFPFYASWGFSQEGFFLGSGADLRSLVISGENVDGGQWSAFADHTGLNDSGVFAFAGSLNYPGLSLRNALFLGKAGAGGGFTSQRLAREGDAVPGGNGQFGAFSVHEPVNAAGQFAFSSALAATSGGATDNAALFRASASEFTLIARRGQPLPTGPGQLASTGFFTPKINAAGTVAFRSELSGTGSTANDSAIFFGSGGGLTQVLREDQAAPNPAGVAAGRFDSFPSDFAFNDAGQIAFATTTALRGATTPTISSVHGVFATDGIDLINAARTGEMAGGIVMRSFGMGRHSLNRHGQIAYLASLTGGGTVLRLWTPDLRWRTNGDGLWSASQNWTLGLMPAAMHRVFIEPEAALTVAGPAANASVKSLKIGGGAGAAELRWAAGATLTAAEGITVSSNGTLSGGGVAAAPLVCEGTLSPGASGSAGWLTVTGAAQLAGSAVVKIELGGAGGMDSDRMIFQGGVALAGALEVSLINGHAPAAGQVYLIAAVDGTRTGTFAGLPEGALVGTFGGRDLHLTYAGGDGNDLVLTASALPVSPLPPPTIDLEESTGHVLLLFHGHAGRNYVIQRSTDMAEWAAVHSAIAPASGEIPFTDTTPPPGRVFYRAKPQ